MKLLLIRHAESEGNATGEYGTAQADSLSSKGQLQASQLAKGLEDWEFQKVIVSPLLRTLQTIGPFLEKRGAKGEVWPEVAECCWQEEREAAAERWASRDAEIPEGMADLFVFRNGERLQPAHPETFGMGLRRVMSSLEMFKAESRVYEGTVLLVTHGHFIREILNLMLTTSDPIEFHQGNCGMTLMRFEEGCWSMDFCNRHPNGVLP